MLCLPIWLLFVTVKWDDVGYIILLFVVLFCYGFKLARDAAHSRCIMLSDVFFTVIHLRLLPIFANKRITNIVWEKSM